MRRASGFTLLELMIATAIAMAMATMVVVTFLQTRAMINRAESRLAMHVTAQTLYAHLHRSFSSMMQSCAVVLSSTARSGTTPGTVSIIFMHGKEASEDWRTSAKNGIRMNSDLVWDQWIWKGAKGALYAATSQPLRTPTIGKSFIPFAGGPNLHTIDWWQSWSNLPQPRRTLDPAQPTRTLDDNIYFPDPASPADRLVSLADLSDIGDYTDLQRQLEPVVERVLSPAPGTDPAFTLQVVAHDGTVTTVDDSAATTTVLQGVWLDGRLAPLVTAPQVFATSDAAKRPKLVRIRFMLRDPKADFYQTFSFSFALPGMAPPQPGAVP